MSKTKEELNAMKKEVEAVSEKLAELTPEEIAQISGGKTVQQPQAPRLQPIPQLHMPK